MPDEVPALTTVKHAQVEHEELRRLSLDIGDLADCAPDDPRMPMLADRVAAFIESFPCAPRLLELLEERGWTGWTTIRRKDPAGEQAPVG